MRIAILAAFLGLVLLFGCVEPTDAPTNSPEDNFTTGTTDLGCTSPYDGVWKGVISDSGSLKVSRPPDYETTDNPFTAQYDFEMTAKCMFETEDENYGKGTYLNISYVKASHPLFKCTEGCAPSEAHMFISNSGQGDFAVLFPNRAHLFFITKGEDLRVNSEGKIELLVSGNNKDQTIGSLIGDDRVPYSVETYNCQQYGGEGVCIVDYIFKNTIVLTKVG